VSDRWTPLLRGTSTGVVALAVFDASDGVGAALFAGGDFGSAYDSGDSLLARWACPFPAAGHGKTRKR